jgi:hypothetical protein
MAQVERRKKKTKKSRKTKRAEQLFSLKNGSKNKRSNRKKAKFGTFFDEKLMIDQEKMIINKDELKNTDLIMTFEKPKAKFNKFLGENHILMKPSSQKSNKKKREQIEKLKDGDFVLEPEGKVEKEPGNENKIIEEKQEAASDIIELEVEIEDQNDSHIHPSHDFIRNTQKVKDKFGYMNAAIFILVLKNNN